LLFIVSSFAVPRVAQQKVLLFGIVFALAARTGFIFIGAALIMATNVAKSSKSNSPSTDPVLIRTAGRSVPPPGLAFDSIPALFGLSQNVCLVFPVYQRRQSGARRRTGHDAVVDGDRRRLAHHDGGVVALTTWAR
jgi:hypothetical protein